MSELSSKTNKTLTAVFIALVVGISLLCIFLSNTHYDELSRYPYTDENSRELIRKYLNEEEVDYIIEYSIAPNVFIAFIQEENFNIYHASEYKALSEHQWQETPERIVQMVEETRDVVNNELLISYLDNYSYEEVSEFLKNGDNYIEDCRLLLNASNIEAYIDQSYTLGKRKPPFLISIDNLVVKTKGTINIDSRVQEPLAELCKALETDTNISACGGLVVEKGYVSYQTQENLYHEHNDYYIEPYPGHCESQLGLAVEFEVPGILDDNFEITEQGQWLKNNAYKYGFVQTYNKSDESITNVKSRPYHYRYIGKSLAIKLHNEGNSFARYSKALLEE